jgi:hypothetical protein
MPDTNLPTNLSYGTVVGRFLLAYADGTDVDLGPDGAAAKGSIFFTPSVITLKDNLASPAPVTVLPKTVECTLDTDGYLLGPDGTRGVRLLATDDLDANPVNWTWEVDFRLTDQSDTPISGLSKYSFQLPASTTVDLTLVSPVPGANGTYYNVGPTGPTGPQADLSNVNAEAPLVFNPMEELFSFDWNSTSIAYLADVELPTPALIGNGDMLKYNAETSSWINANIIDGGNA